MSEHGQASADPDGGRPPHVHTVIVGYGHAGRDLHARALGELDEEPARPWTGRTTTVVDPLGPGDQCSYGWVPRLEDLPRLTAEPMMFHITVPPDLHVPVTRELIALGARHALIEKPIAPSAAAARALFLDCERAGLDLIPVGVWTESRVTDAVRDRIASAAGPKQLVMEQSKDRTELALGSSAHDSAWDVEVPHQVLLALSLLGPVESVRSARIWELRTRGRTVPGMGGARLVLGHRDGSTSDLLSQLDSPERRRVLSIRTSTGTVHAGYPESADAPTGHVRSDGEEPSVIVDRPLTQCIARAYLRMIQGGPRHFDRDLHVRALEILDIARSLVGTQAQEGGRHL